VQKVRFATSRFVYCGEELFTINSKSWEVLEAFFRRCTIFMQCFYLNKMCNLVVLLDFDDIKFILQFLDRRHCSVRSGVCFNRSQGLFQPSDATINPI
jgi:hypothetical protein